MRKKSRPDIVAALLIGRVKIHAQGFSKIFPHSASNQLTVTIAGHHLSHLAQPGTALSQWFPGSVSCGPRNQ